MRRLNGTMMGSQHPSLNQCCHPVNASHGDVGRHSRVAEIQVEEGESLPPLHDCVLLKAGPGFWSMTGFERIEGPNGRITDYVQTWVLCPLGELS